MTDRELDALLERVLIGAVKRDWEGWEEQSAFTASHRHRRQMRAMLKNPLGWARERARPMWRPALRRVAVVALAASVLFAGILAASPTARAVVSRWVAEWYESHVTYQYSGRQTAGEMPQYEIGELPEGYVEDESRRVELPGYVCTFYWNQEKGTWIVFDYMYMQQGSASDFITENTGIVSVTVNGLSGVLFQSSDPESADSTVTWIDPDHNLQFSVSAFVNEDSILHMAESVYLVKMTNQ